MRNHQIWSSTLAVFLLTVATASAQPHRADEGQIINRATTITRSGAYVLGRTIFSSADGVAVDIQANNVTLNLGGYAVVGPGGKRGMGIRADGVRNVRIHGGALRRFGVGVVVSNSTNVVLEDLQIDGEDLGGTPPDVEVGILLIEARGVRVERNQITNTFLGIFVRGETSGGNRIAQNTITGGENGELGICYNPADGGNPNGGPDGDLVYGNLVSHFNGGIALSAGSTDNIVTENSLAVFDAAIAEATAGSNSIEDNREVVLTP